MDTGLEPGSLSGVGSNDATGRCHGCGFGADVDAERDEALGNLGLHGNCNQEERVTNLFDRVPFPLERRA
jgi:hypothetical protein